MDFELCNEMFDFIYLAGLSWIVSVKKDNNHRSVSWSVKSKQWKYERIYFPKSLVMLKQNN